MDQFKRDCEALDADWTEYFSMTLGEAYRDIECNNGGVYVIWAYVNENEVVA